MFIHIFYWLFVLRWHGSSRFLLFKSSKVKLLVLELRRPSSGGFLAPQCCPRFPLSLSAFLSKIIRILAAAFNPPPSPPSTHAASDPPMSPLIAVSSPCLPLPLPSAARSPLPVDPPGPSNLAWTAAFVHCSHRGGGRFWQEENGAGFSLRLFSSLLCFLEFAYCAPLPGSFPAIIFIPNGGGNTSEVQTSPQSASVRNSRRFTARESRGRPGMRENVAVAAPPRWRSGRNLLCVRLRWESFCISCLLRIIGKYIFFCVIIFTRKI